MKGAISSGHPLTSKAAAEMLSAGGNAFDAAVAAGFASVVAEPSLASLGGGGFLLAHRAKQKEDIFFDFFVQTPGLGRTGSVKPRMKPVEIKFPRCSQTFHTGFGSAAVPGMLKGLLHVHKRLCTLPLETILSPSLSYLETGIRISELHGYFLSLLKPIFTSTPYGKSIYESGEMLFNPLLRDFYLGLSRNGTDIYSGVTAENFIKEMADHGGLITMDDLAAYEVIEREPLRIRYRDREILTNPPPSSGGLRLALGLHLLEKTDLDSVSFGSKEHLIPLIETMKEINDFRPMKNGNRISHPFSSPEAVSLVKSFINSISDKTFVSTKGTTHLSVIDEEGNAVSMTTSNGSGSGCFIPKTGIMLNNMMGEDDLHPDGFFSSAPDRRVSSMMIPSMTMKDGRVDMVIGSGGSKRIKTAVLQVLINSIDFNVPLNEAIEAPRIHYEDGVVQLEPDAYTGLLEMIRKHYEINIWDRKDIYFGGAHCVNSWMQGWGDTRRGGSFISA